MDELFFSDPMSAQAATTSTRSERATLTVAESQLATTPEAKQLGELIAAVDPEAGTYDERKVPAAVLAGQSADTFKEVILRQGGTVIGGDGATTTGDATNALFAVAAASALSARSSGSSMWVVGWGVHFTVTSATMAALVGAAAGGAGTAAAVAGVLALNVEGFPANLGDAAAAGAVAAALAAASGVYALCNGNGNGAQINDNWAAVTCWPL